MQQCNMIKRQNAPLNQALCLADAKGVFSNVPVQEISRRKVRCSCS